MKLRCLLSICLFIAFSSTAQELQKPVRLKTGTLTRANNIQRERNMTAALRPVQYKNSYYTLIQFNKLPGKQQRQQLEKEGIVLFTYIPENTYLAEVKASVAPLSLKRNMISGVFALEPSSKIAAGVPEKLSTSATDPNSVIAVHFFGSIDKATVMAELTAAGAQVANTKIQPANVVFVNAKEPAVQKIARLPFVAYISSQYLKDVPVNYNNHGAHSVNALSSTVGRNLQGQNTTIGIGDNADPSTHVDFTGRLINRFPLTPEDHGTHTTGTVAGAGILNPKYKGMAPKATIISQMFSDILVNTPFNVADYNMVLTNNSYYNGLAGCPGQGDYDVLSNFVDVQMNNDPSLLHVFAAGNDGNYNCSPYPASFATIKSGFQCGKNVLTVGGMNTADYSIINFSSRGPVDDGRLKPEIVAGGANVVSTVRNNGYTSFSGTSMAAPTVTGTLALLYQRYRQLHGGDNPPAALMKAITCNTADDLGNPGPDFTFGFGSLNARNAVEAIEGNHYFINTVSSGGTSTHTITGIPAGTHQVKVMLYWNDPAAAPFAATTMVNNLDLSVTAGGSVHLPLVLNPNPGGVYNVATEGVDNTNNIEQVVINNPSGDLVINISGTDIPTGQQEYVLVYQIIQPSVTLEYPFGKETMVPGEQEIIRWSAYGSNNTGFTVEYSVNGGSNWTTINNNVSPASRSYAWSVPNLPTGTALIRVTRNVAGYSDVTEHPFTILGQPNLTVSNTCPGYAQLSWGAVSTATGYEIMMLRGDSMQTIATAATTSYLLGGLSKDSTYWLSVRALQGSVAGRRSISKAVTPAGGSCPSPTYNHDFAPDLLTAPVTGRMHTSSALSNAVAPQVRVRNLGRVASTGSFNVSYQINNGAIVTETSSAIIPALSTYTYTFSTTCDLSAPGTYSIRVWVDYGNDVLHTNDTLRTIAKQLKNDAVALSPSYTEGFESSASQTYYNNAMGFEGVDRGDFRSNNSNGRARTFVNTEFAHSGNRAVTLDQKSYSTLSSSDSLILTFNLGNYSASDQLWLDYFYKNHGIDFELPGNKVWIRGSENNAWIEVFTLPVDNISDIGKYLSAAPVNITETLAAAVPAQTVSSSFQVKFGQQGFTSANTVIPDGNVDDGITYDDVTITLASNDVSMRKVLTPSVENVCSLGATETISVKVKNAGAATLTNVPVSYSINGATVTENIPSIAAHQEADYVFTQKANLQTYQPYVLKTWVHYPADTYKHNDTLTYSFTTVPVISNYPYREGFENNNGYWHAGGINSSWQWGKPENSVINKAANGSNAWVTGLTGNYNNGEKSYLYSPCFDLSGLAQPVLSFSHIFLTEDNCYCDAHWVEYSTDGTTWTKLGDAASGINWYDDVVMQQWQVSNTRWHVSSFDVPATGSSVRFRFVMNSDVAVSFEGVGIDDIHLFDKRAIYNGADLSAGLEKIVNDSNWIDFEMNGKIVASVNSHGQNLGTTKVKVFTNTSQVRNNGYQYYLDRNIVVEPANQPQQPVSIRYYFRQAEALNLINAVGCSSCDNISDPYEAGVTQYSGLSMEENGSLHDNDSGLYHFITPDKVDIVPYDDGYFAEFNVHSFSEFWINSGGPNQILAIPEIIDSFSATKVNKSALLEWTTWKELNVGKFIVEKSVDGISFNTIAEVVSTGDYITAGEYSFTDDSLVWGMNYYRIATVHQDGQTVRSVVDSINYNGSDLKIVDSFTVKEVNETAMLRWITFTESNTSKFIIEKSADDITYTVIGEVAASGNTNTLNEYEFTDASLLWGANYYRIKTVNSIGQYVYSPVRMIDNTGRKLLTYVFPNPVKNGVVYINTTVDCSRLELRSALGTTVIAKNVQGRQNVLDVHRVAPGLYFLTIVTEAGKKIEKVLVAD